MGQVDAFDIPGVECWFNSHDHFPAHFHARRPGEWEIRVYFLLCTRAQLVCDVKWGGDPERKYRRAILDAVLESRTTLLLEWEDKVCR